MPRLLSESERVESFWRNVARASDAECWAWTGRTIRTGYGLFLWTANGKRTGTTAHRYAFQLMHGALPKDVDLDHLCRNRACVNPAHLDPVSHTENVRRGRSGAFNREKTHCVRGHAYSPENTRRNSKGGRVCRKCSAIHTVNWKRRKRGALDAIV